RRPRTGLKVASTRHYARCCYRTGACGWHDANAPWNGGCNNTPTPQHPCTRSSSNSTTTLACEPNQFPKNPSARRSMIAPSQPKKASAFNEDGKEGYRQKCVSATVSLGCHTAEAASSLSFLSLV